MIKLNQMIKTLCIISFMILSTITYGLNDKPNLRRACVSDNDSDIVLHWIVPTDNCGSFRSIHIWAKPDLISNFTIIDSVNNLSQDFYIHKGANKISKDWNYFLIYHTLCNGDSSLSSDTIIIDSERPNPSLLDSVSINYMNGDLLLGWRKNSSKDIAGYLIVQNIGSSNVSIGQTTDTFFTIKGRGVKDSSFCYGIAAYDSCGLTAAVPSFHCSINLRSTLDDCKGIIGLQWSKYLAWNVLEYNIYVSRNGGPFIIEKTVDGLTDTVQIVGFSPGDSLAIFVRATKDDGTIFSASNLVGYNLKTQKLPKINYLSNVTVDNDQKVVLTWITDTLSEISTYKIYRSIGDSTKWLLNASVPYSGKQILSYKDEKVDVSKNIYYYKILVFDNCGKFTGSESNISNTMLLRIDTPPVVSLNDTNLHLIWNNYNNWLSGVSYYRVYRGGDCGEVDSFSLLYSNKPEDTVYFDQDLPFAISCKGVCYYIEAAESKKNPYTGKLEKAKSNIFCELREHQFYFPNAFCPFGVNRRWKPVGSYIDYPKSYIKIFNNWGQLVKELNGDDIWKGWDGKDKNGELYAEGTYIFWGYIKGLNAAHKNYSGTFYLIR